MKEKFLLDTDIGSDIDDAVCLAYLFVNPDCGLMGMTKFTPAEESFCDISVDVNPDLFFQHFFSFFI